MRLFLKRYLLWLFYAAFVLAAAAFGGREGFVTTESDYAIGKYLVAFVYFSFLLYSLHATSRENFFRTLGVMNRLYWGRQIGLDLYISVFLSLALIYLAEGSIWIMALWLVPVFVFANLAILPYVILNYGFVVGHFLP